MMYGLLILGLLLIVAQCAMKDFSTKREGMANKNSNANINSNEKDYLAQRKNN